MQTSKVTPQDIEKARALLVSFNGAVLEGDPFRAHDAHMAYDALVHELNGGTSFGSYAAEDSPGILLQNALRAEPGETPMWGQQGDFLIVVDGNPAYVEYQPSFRLHAMQFHAVRQTPFISETGFRSEILSDKPAREYARTSVRETALTVFAKYMRDSRRPVYPSRVARDHAALPFVVKELGELVSEITPGRHVFIKATKQVGLVITVSAKKSKGPVFAVATLTDSKSNPQIVEQSYGYDDVFVLDAVQLQQTAHPAKFLTVHTVNAIRSIKKAENAA